MGLPCGARRAGWEAGVRELGAGTTVMPPRAGSPGVFPEDAKRIGVKVRCVSQAIKAVRTRYGETTGGGASPELLLGSWGLAEPSGGFEFFPAFFHVISPNESSLIIQVCFNG